MPTFFLGDQPWRQLERVPTDGEVPAPIAHLAVPRRQLAIYIDRGAFRGRDTTRSDRFSRVRLRESEGAAVRHVQEFGRQFCG